MSGLIVPVDVIAYCVGESTLTARAAFAGRRPTSASRPAGPGVPGDQRNPRPRNDPPWPLEAGVHLHWAMPDALTAAASVAGG